MFDGPDSLKHLNNISVDAVIAELQTNAPDVYCLFKTLGATSCNVQSNEERIVSEDIRAHTALFHTSEGTICTSEGYTTSAKLYADGTSNKLTGKLFINK